MKSTVFAILLAVSSQHLTSAQTMDSITAGDLERYCVADSVSAEKAGCVFIVKGYLDGFIEGAGFGVLGTYANDPEIFEQVKDIKAPDFITRFNSTARKATCINKASIDVLTTAFLTYVRAHPKSV